MIGSRRRGLPVIAEFDPPGLLFVDLDADIARLRAAGVEIDDPHLIHHDMEGTFGPAEEEEWMAFFLDPTATATWRLGGATVVVTLEPCTMCAGLLQQARIDRLVYGAADMKAGACGSLYNLGADPRLNHEYAVVAGVRADECAALLTTFFTDRRSTP